MHFNMVFPVVMYRCECWAIKKSWVPKDWCVWIVVLEKTLESLLDCKDIKLVNPKGNQPWIFIGKTDAKAKAPILWPPDVKNWLIRKGPDSRTDWGQRAGEEGATKDEMVKLPHRLNGHEFEQTPGDSREQKSLDCCSPWGCKESDANEQLNDDTYYVQLERGDLETSYHSQSWNLYPVLYLWLSIFTCEVAQSPLEPAECSSVCKVPSCWQDTQPPDSAAWTRSYRRHGPGILPRWRSLALLLLASSCSF